MVSMVEVSVRKLRPPIPVQVVSVGVTMKRHAAGVPKQSPPPVEAVVSPT